MIILMIMIHYQIFKDFFNISSIPFKKYKINEDPSSAIWCELYFLL